MPIYLDIDREDYKNIKKTNLLNIFFNNLKICDIYINSIYKINSKKKLGNKLFNTKDEKHPGFANFLKTKNFFIEGKTENFNNQILKKLFFSDPEKVEHINDTHRKYHRIQFNDENLADYLYNKIKVYISIIILLLNILNILITQIYI